MNPAHRPNCLCEDCRMPLPVNREREKMISWRTEQLLAAGYTARLAVTVAESEADLHYACEIVTAVLAKGKGPELAALIVL